MSAGVPAALLFDLDGTLVDTAPDLAAAANHVRALRGLPALPDADYRPYASAGARGLLGKALGLAPDDSAFADARALFLAYYRSHIADRSVLFDGIAEVLAACRAAGLHWGIVTNKPAWLTRPLIEALGLTPACAVSGDEVPRAKPAPDSLLHACALLGLAPQACIYVGDDLRDIVAGRAAGMRTIAAAWGYLGEAEPIECWNADAIIQRPTDLNGWLSAGA